MATVSIILTTYNRSKLLPKAIESVYLQTFTDYELIIVDDGSTDNTSEVVDTCKRSNTTYLYQENKGLSTARNLGLQVSRSKYVAFLDDDDLWHMTKLEKQVNHLETCTPEVALNYCWMKYLKGETCIQVRKPRLQGHVFQHLIASQSLTNGSCWLLRRDAITKVGMFDPKIMRGVDGYFLRKLALSYQVDYLPEVLVDYQTEHYSTRITNSSQTSIRNALHSDIRTLIEHPAEVVKYPRMKARLEAKIAKQLNLAGYHTLAGQFAKKAFLKAPYDKYVAFRLMKMWLQKKGIAIEEQDELSRLAETALKLQ